MPYFDKTLWTGQTFAERIGEPDEFSSAIGWTVINFASLEHAVSECVAMLLDLEESKAQLLLAEYSFKVKVGVLSSLFRLHIKKLSATVDGHNRLKVFEELCGCIFRCEELRNTVLHSNWVGPFLRDRAATRRKITAKAAHGLRIHEEHMDSGKLLDISDYIGVTAHDLTDHFSWLAFENECPTNESLEDARGE